MTRTRPALVSALVALAFALAALSTPRLASADSMSECQAAVQAKLEEKAPKSKKFKFANKIKTVTNAKKDKEELKGRGTYVGKGGEKKEMGWKCVYDLKAGKVKDVDLQLEQ